MTDKRFTIIGEEWISYYGGSAQKVSDKDYDCIFHIWERKEDAEKVVERLNELHEESIKLKQKIENQKNHQITLESKIHRMKEQFRRRKK